MFDNGFLNQIIQQIMYINDNRFVLTFDYTLFDYIEGNYIMKVTKLNQIIIHHIMLRSLAFFLFTSKICPCRTVPS